MTDMSQGPLQAIISRIARYNETGDPAEILSPEADAEAELLARAGVNDFNVLMALGRFHWYRYNVLPAGEDAAELDVALAMYGLVIGAIPPPLLPILLKRLRDGSVLARPGPAQFEALLAQAASSGDHETFDRAVEAIRRTIASLPGDDPAVAVFNGLLGRALRTRFGRTRDMNDLEDCIASFQGVLAAGSADDQLRLDVQGGLAASLRDRYRLTGVVGDLGEAIELTEAVVRDLPPDDRDGPAVAADLGNAFRERFEAAADTADIDASIAWLTTASDRVDGTDPVRPQFLANLARSYQVRYERLGEDADLGRATALLREAVDEGHPRPASMLTLMLGMFRKRFGSGADPADLDAAIDAGREALALPSSPEEGSRQWLRMQLIDCYLDRFDRAGQAGDLEEAVRLSQDGVEASPPDTPDRLVALASARRHLWLRVDPDHVPDHLRAHPLFDRTALKDADQLAAEASVMLQWAQQADRVTAVEMAIWLLQDALPGFAPDSDNWLNALSDLGVAYDIRGERTGAVADIDEAIATHRRVLDITRPDHPRLPGFHSNLAVAFRRRFLITGQLADLDAAVEQARIAAASNPHPRRAMYLTNLGALLGDRYGHLGSVTDLREAIQVSREAVAATEPGDLNRASNMSNLASVLLDSVRVNGNPAEASEAVDVLTEALSLTPDHHPGRAQRLDTLGMAHELQYQSTRSAADLGRAVQRYRQAVLARDKDDPDRGKSLAGLGTTLIRQHQHDGDAGPLDEGIAALAQAAASTPPRHPDHPRFQLFLGHALETRYRTSADVSDADAAIAAYREGAIAPAGPASSRLSAAHRWAELAMSRPGQRHSAIAGYTVAADLLHRVAWRGLTLADRERALARWSGLPGDMAACALAGDLADRAVELLENSRAVLWTQLLDMRTTLTQTRVRSARVDTILARLEAIRTALDTSGHLDTSIGPEHLQPG